MDVGGELEVESTLKKNQKKKKKKDFLILVLYSLFHPPPPIFIMFSYYATLLIFPVEMGSSSNKCIRQVSHEWPWQQKLHRGQVPV